MFCHFFRDLEVAERDRDERAADEGGRRGLAIAGPSSFVPLRPSMLFDEGRNVKQVADLFDAAVAESKGNEKNDVLN